MSALMCWTICLLTGGGWGAILLRMVDPVGEGGVTTRRMALVGPPLGV